MCKCNTTIAAPGEQNILWKLSILVEIERILHPSFIRTTRPLHTPHGYPGPFSQLVHLGFEELSDRSTILQHVA
jgi:hypothetical protein